METKLTFVPVIKKVIFKDFLNAVISSRKYFFQQQIIFPYSTAACNCLCMLFFILLGDNVHFL